MYLQNCCGAADYLKKMEPVGAPDRNSLIEFPEVFNLATARTPWRKVPGTKHSGLYDRNPATPRVPAHSFWVSTVAPPCLDVRERVGNRGSANTYRVYRGPPVKRGKPLEA